MPPLLMMHVCVLVCEHRYVFDFDFNSLFIRLSFAFLFASGY